MDDVTDEEPDLGRTETWGTTTGAGEEPVTDVPGRGDGGSGVDEEVRVQLRRAIEALEEVDTAL